MNLALISPFHKEQIGLLQQSIWDLEKARSSIFMANGNSDMGKSYIAEIADLIKNLQNDIDDIYADYEKN